MSKGLVKKDLEGTLKDLIKIQKNFIGNVIGVRVGR
tara:strand:+ start:497 stop:604 length:108 start_codon:yes stop_codon:yes gene_type:complete